MKYRFLLTAKFLTVKFIGLIFCIFFPLLSLLSAEKSWYYNEYNRLAQAKDWQAALKVLEEGTAEYPAEAGLKLNLAIVYTQFAIESKKVNDKASELANWEKAYRLAPNSDWIVNGYAWTLADSGKLVESIQLFEDCISRFSKYIWCRQNLPYTYVRYAEQLKNNGDKEGAFIYWKKAYQSAPNADYILNGYAYVLSTHNEFDESIRIFRDCIRRFPKYEWCAKNLPWVYLGKFNALKDSATDVELQAMLQQALHELRAAGDYDPNSAYVQIIWNGLPRVANDIFFKKFTHQLIQLYPKQSQLYEALGLIYISKAENAHQPISENILKQVISLRRKGRDLFDAGATEVPTLKLTAFPFNARFLVTTPWNGEVWSHVGIQGKHCYDLMGVDEQGKVIKAGGDGKSNEDFHTFGIELMAVANGTVVSATMGSSDQPPGERNWQPGNTVMIRHVDGSYAYYDHLKYPGPSVKVGEPVRQGQVIGHMGNTGASGAPHLHFCLFRDVNSTRVTIPYTFPTRNITSEKRSGQSQGPYRKGDIVIP